MTEKNHQDQEYDQYATDSDEMESIDQNEYASRSEVYQEDEGSRDDYMNDSPCVTTCCCCCSLGLGSIIAGVLFMVSCSTLLFLFLFWLWGLAPPKIIESSVVFYTKAS